MSVVGASRGTPQPLLAWIDLSRCRGYGTSGYFQPMKEQTHFDLSFRSTFNDEPGESDLPRYAIRTVRTRDAWPTCATCKKRIHLSYGCQCPESERILDEAKVVEQKNDKERQARLAALLQQHRSVTNSLLMQFGELTAELRNR